MKSRPDNHICGLFSARERLLGEIKDPAEKDSFVFETFLSFQKYGWIIAKSADVCRSLESFIPFCNVDSLVVLLKTLSVDWDGVIKCRVCHHLLRKALHMCQTSPFADDSLIKDFVGLFLDHTKKHMDSYIAHPCGHHTLRLYLQLTAGVQLGKDKVTNTYVRERSTLCTPFDAHYVSTVNSLMQQFLMASDAYTYARSELISPFLQILILIASLRGIDTLSENLDEIIDVIGLFSKLKRSQRLPDGFIHPVLVYLTEMLISIMPGKRFAKFMHLHILHEPNEQSERSPVPPIKAMVCHPIASRIARAVIKRIKKPTDLQAVLTTLADAGAEDAASFGLSEVISSSQHAVLNDLAIKCSNPEFSMVQKQFCKMLYLSLGHSGKKSRHADEDCLIRAVVGLTSISNLNSTVGGDEAATDLTHPVNLPGCLLAETLLRYTTARPKVLVASICSQSRDRLSSWASHPMLSRVLESVVQSEVVSPRRIIQLLSALEPNLVQLACDRYGSRLVEAFWNTANKSSELDDVKKCILTKLANSLTMLHSHPFGRFVARSLHSRTVSSAKQKRKESSCLQSSKQSLPPVDRDNSIPSKKMKLDSRTRK